MRRSKYGREQERRREEAGGSTRVSVATGAFDATEHIPTPSLPQALVANIMLEALSIAEPDFGRCDPRNIRLRSNVLRTVTASHELEPLTHIDAIYSSTM